LCDFGFARAIESREKTRMTMCVPEDHEVLTNRGFLDLEGWLRLRDDPTLRVAGYCAATEQLVFERPCEDFVLLAETRELVEFSANGLSYLVTGDHDVYVQRGEYVNGSLVPVATRAEAVESNSAKKKCVYRDSRAAKVRAGLFLERADDATYGGVRHVAAARGGVRVSGGASPPFVAALALASPEQEAAFLRLYGRWLCAGSLSRDKLSFGETDSQWLHNQFVAAGLASEECDGECDGECVVAERWVSFFAAEYSQLLNLSNGRPFDDVSSEFGSYLLPEPFSDAKWCASWVWTLGRDALRCVLDGMSQSFDTMVMSTRSARFRDEIVRVQTLAGFSAACSFDGERYVVDGSADAFPESNRAKNEIRPHEASGRVWCLTMPSGLFWVRRNETSRAVVTGNCGSPYFNAPELLLGKAYNEKADVFAFGILLCEIITRAAVNLDRLGKKEFNAYALDLDGLRQKVPKDCPGPFWKLAVCCVSYEPEKRPSMGQIEKMIAAILKSTTGK
jgi:serine/threonine protein kinase